MRLAIADPPYPPMRGGGGIKPRASRWYGDNQRATSDRPADVHAGAAEWDAPERHRQLLLDLMRDYDGWAIATAPDGLQAYGELPLGTRVMAWFKPNAQPGSHRLRSHWEPVIIYPPAGRRTNRGGVGQMSDVLTADAPRLGFPGAKPAAWTHWVLAALGHDALTDTLDDLFPGSGSVAAALSSGPDLALFDGSAS